MPWLTQSSFAAGEIDPSMVARTDLAKMSMAALTLRNRTVLPHGPSEVRPGFGFIHAAKNDYGNAVLRPFVYSLGQNYVLEFGDGYVRFYKDGGIILDDANTIYEVATPYSHSDVYELNFTQSADLLYITHRDYPIQVLARFDHADWVCSSFAFVGGPFLPANLTETTLTASARVGPSVALTASASLFQAGHVGALWQITHEVATQAVSGTFAATGASGTVRGRGTWKVITHGTWSAKLYLERSADGTTWESYAAYSGAADNNILDEEESDGLYSYRLHCYEYTSGSMTYDLTMSPHEWGGVVQVTAVTDDKHATVNVLEELAATTATKTWAEGAWSNANGWPACSAFYQNRLCLAGSPGQPETVNLSRTDDYKDFSLGTSDDAAIALPLVSRQSNTVNSRVARKQIIAFTAASEFIIDANGGVLTPTTPVATEQESNGIGSIDPLLVPGNRVVFVAPRGDIVLDIGYNFTEDSYGAKQLSILANHLFRGHRIIDSCYQKAPESICWFVRDDGALLGLTYLKDQEIWAWHRHDTDGKVLSVCSVQGPDRNELWLLVERRVGSSTKRYVERMEASVPSQDPADQRYLDSCLAYVGAAITQVTGLDHLEGRSITVVADGMVERDLVVEGGSVTLSAPATKICAGLPYVADLELPDADFQAQDGSVQGRKKRLNQVILRVQNARGGMVGLNFNTMDPLPATLPGEYDTATPLFSGDVEVSFPADIDTTARVCLRQIEPMPLTVLAVIREVALCD